MKIVRLRYRSKGPKKNEEDVAKTREKGINKELLERYLEEF